MITLTSDLAFAPKPSVTVKHTMNHDHKSNPASVASHYPTDSHLDAIIQKAKTGDVEAFRDIFHRHKDDVARIVFRIIGQDLDAEDVIQDVFLHVYRSLHTFRGESKFSTWLYRLTSNVAKMHIRKMMIRPRLTGASDPDEEISKQQCVETETDSNKRMRKINACIAKLSEKKRDVLIMHDLEGTAPEEIAHTLGIPVLTVRTRLFYARKELYALLQNEASLHELLPTPKTPKTNSSQKPRDSTA